MASPPRPPDRILFELDELLAREAPVAVLAQVPARDGQQAGDVAAGLAAVSVLCELGRIVAAREESALAVARARRLEDPVWIGRSVAASAWVSWTEGDAKGAVQLARRAAAEAPEDPRTRLVTRLILGSSARRSGEWAEALGTLESDGPSTWFAGLALVARVEALTAAGDLDSATRELEAAFSRLDPARRVLRGWFVVALALLARAAGDEEGGRRAIDAELLALDGVDAAVVGELCLLRGTLHHESGDLDAAAADHRRALALFGALSHPRRAGARRALALTVLSAGHAEEARALLAEPTAVDVEAEAPLRAAVAAALGDRAGWALHHERARTFLAAGRTGDEDHATALRLAAEGWSRSGLPDAPEHAFRARTLALLHWERLGRPADAARELKELHRLAKVGVPLPAGPYDLVEVLGTGAMGAVWRGRHHVHGTEAAVKVLRLDATQDEFLRSSFEAEIRAIAALEHPGIVHILGHGVIDAASALASEQRPIGAPWFAMELVTGGTLQELCGRLRWSACRGILIGLLDALAHAHARDVLHLDIKPANIMLEPTMQGLRPRLADFGLSGIAGDGKTTAGTPHFMAPEQFRARDLGPWTDLYAVGCLAWMLVTGGPPYDAPDVVALRNAHVAGVLPELRPVVAVPDGFVAWLERLLDRDATARFQSAADASWALHALRDPPTDAAPLDAAPAAQQATVPVTFSLPVWGELRGADLVQATGPAQVELPPMPVSWKATPADRPHGSAALELFPLRRVPLVGRVRARDLLWATLADVKRRSRARFVSLEGPSGSGRSHLARWLSEIARERGVARCFAARFGNDVSGLAPLVRRALRAEDLTPNHLRSRVARWADHLDEAAALRLVAIAAGRSPEEDDVEVVAELLSTMARSRPLVLWFEGQPAHHPLVVGLTTALLRKDAPLLVVFEVTLGENRDADRRYEEILDLPPTTAVTLEPLAPHELRELVRELLPLDATLVDRITDRAASDADLVVATIADLVRRDALREGSHGLVLRDGQDLTPAATLQRAWVDRLEAVLEQSPLAARDALAVCAVAAGRVPPDAWRAICEAVGLEAPSRLVRALRNQRSLVPTEDRGWRFGHWTLPVYLREEAAVDGRLPRLSRLAAEHLPFEDPGRRGTALLDAGLAEEALEPLGEALRRSLERGDGGAATGWCEALEGALRVQGIPEDDPRWLGVRLSRAHLARSAGRRDEALELARAAAGLAEQIDQPLVLFQALSLVSALEGESGDGVGSTATLKRALAVARGMEDPTAVARVRLAVADAARQRGDLEGSARHYERGLRELDGLSDARTLAALKLGLGLVQAARGQLDEAALTLEQARQELDEAGDEENGSEARTALARIACRQGRTRDASRWFAEALDLLPASDRSRRADVLLDRCMVLLADGRWSELADAVRDVVDETPGLPLDTRTWAFTLLLCARVEAPDEEWSVLADTLENLLRQTLLVDSDVATVLETAASRPEAAGARSRRCWGLAEAQWRTLGERGRARLARERARAGDA